jgi:4-diphosphocytidyl-2-C-methyl-D-erythritol kinase
MLKNPISLSSMILFSPAKINIGLKIIERRPDGFHNLQSVMYPTGLCDILEIRSDPSGKPGVDLSQSGIPIGDEAGTNLCIKAYEIMAKEVTLPAIRVHLHKRIPVGAGLGGGSSNASLTLTGLNRLARQPLSPGELEGLAATLGSDCPFFLHHEAMMMEGRGEILSPVTVYLDDLYIALLFPGIHISTAEAYSVISPIRPEQHLSQMVKQPVDQWKGIVINDFERVIFKKYPELEGIKSGLYAAGALYASMSGSGSALYGIFPRPPVLPANLACMVVWTGKADKPAVFT